MNSSPVDFATLYNLAHTPEAVTVQHALLTAGFYKGKIDGAFGPMSETARQAYSKANGLPDRKVFVGSNGCTWTVFSDGLDLCARTILGTCFGSMADVRSGQDNGITASGFSLKTHPAALVVSLPMSYTKACLGSPWGKRIPFGTAVQISLAGATSPTQGSLQEVGPSSYTGNGVDISEGMCRKMLGNPASFNPNSFKHFVDVRVINGLALSTR